MTKRRKSRLIFAVMFFLMSFLIFLAPTQTFAAVTYTRVANSNVFRINNFTEIAGQETASNLAGNPILGTNVSGTSIDIPITLSGGTSSNPGDFSSLITSAEGGQNISTTDAETLGYIKNLYQYIANSGTSTTDKQTAAGDVTVISRFLSAYNPLTNPGAMYTSDVSISPTSFIQNTDFAATVTANYNGPTSGMACFLYVGTGTGSYIFKKTAAFASGSSTCTLQWDVSGSDIATTSNGTQTTLRGFFVTFQSTNWTHANNLTGSPNSPAILISPFAQGSVEIVPKNPTGSISVKVSPATVALGGDVTFSATVTNASAFSGKECVYYFKTDLDAWEKEGVGQLPDCSFPISTENLGAGEYPIMVNLQDIGVDDSSSATPASTNSATLKVCATDDAACLSTVTPPGTTPPTVGGGGGGGSTSSFGTFNPIINTVALAATVRNGNLRTVEGAFELIISIAETLIGILAFFAIIVGGFLVITAGGDATAAAKGKKSIMYGIIGIVVASLSYSIVVIIVKELKHSGFVS